MLLYSGIITLDYDPATDVLVALMPDARQFGLPEVSFCLDLTVESVRNYDIQHLLLDSSQSAVEIGGEAFRAVLAKFGTDLMKTRLQKIAGVATAGLLPELSVPVAFRSFPSQAEAMVWLLSSVPA